MVRSIFDGDVWASFVKGDTGEVVRPSSGDLDDGWSTATYPNRKYDNWAKLILFEACQWIEEKGVFDWDSNITYSTGALVNYSGTTYISILASNLNQQPDTATTYWQNYYDWLIAQAGQTMVVADEAALGTGVVDGQIRGTVAGNQYTWDETDTKWNARDGNHYASTPAFGNIQFYAGTIASIADITKRYNGSSWEEIAAVTTGRFERPEFIANESSTQIDLVGPGGYHLAGKGWVHWTGTLAYNFTTLAASTWSYLYLDESTISGPGIITASNLTDSTTAPTYSSTTGGWYNGNDRCIMAVYGLGASSYTLFRHRYDYVQYSLSFADVSAVAITVGGVAYALTVPAFCRRALITIRFTLNTTGAIVSQRESGLGTSYGHQVGRTSTGATEGYDQVIADLSSAQQVSLFASVAGTDGYILTDGFYLPKGM